MLVGATSIIDPSAEIADDVEIGEFCIIGPSVRIGSGARVMNHVELRAGTEIGRGCLIDSGVRSSGDCTVGDLVTIRYHAILARGCSIGDGTFVSPQVCFINLDEDGREIGGAEVGAACFLGTGAVVQAGIRIAGGSIIGAGALVTASITDAGTYVGVPARRLPR